MAKITSVVKFAEAFNMLYNITTGTYIGVGDHADSMIQVAKKLEHCAKSFRIAARTKEQEMRNAA